MKRTRNWWILWLFSLCCIMPLSPLFAQSVADVGFYGGTNMSKLQERFFSYKNRWGYQAGLSIKVGSKWCQYEAELGYANMGAKYNLTNEVGQIEGGRKQLTQNKFNTVGHYIDLPMSIALGWWDPLESEFGFTISGGAYMEVGVAGQIKVETKVHDYTYDVQNDYFTTEYSGNYFGDAPYQYKRFDAGWTVGAKLCLGEVFRIGASYRHGLINLSNVEGYKVTKNTFFLNFIFVFANADD